jgi:hypothetical protein
MGTIKASWLWEVFIGFSFFLILKLLENVANFQCDKLHDD